MSGTVTFEGKPAAETVVSLQPANGTSTVLSTNEVIAAAQSDENGKFTIPHVPDGTYIISSHRSRRIDNSFRSQSGDPVTVKFPDKANDIVIKLDK